jgi:RNA polymerase sigma-70 factor, ECF subfamily
MLAGPVYEWPARDTKSQGGAPALQSWRVGHVQSSDQTSALLTLVGNGSESAFLSLVRRYEASLMRVAGLWFRDPVEAAELVAETWLKMLRRLDRFDEAASLKGWLCCTLIALVRLRLGPEAQGFLPALSAEDVQPAVDPERFSPPGDRWHGHWRTPPTAWPSFQLAEGAASAELRAELEAALERLHAAERVVLVLRDMEGLSVNEVCSALEISERDQAGLLHQARSRLRDALERHHARKAVAP